MSHRNHPSYDSVVKVTQKKADLNRRAMGKSEAAHEDPRGGDHTISQLPTDEQQPNEVADLAKSPESSTSNK